MRATKKRDKNANADDIDNLVRLSEMLGVNSVDLIRFFLTSFWAVGSCHVYEQEEPAIIAMIWTTKNNKKKVIKQ